MAVGFGVEQKSLMAMAILILVAAGSSVPTNFHGNIAMDLFRLGMS